MTSMDESPASSSRLDADQDNAPRSMAIRALGGVAYSLWLTASVLFTLPIFVFQQLLPNRSAHHAKDHGYGTPPLGVVVAIDVLAALAAYWLADWLRCTLQNLPWPEVVPEYGSTLMVHVRMAAFVAVAWPLILAWLGWYRARWRSWRWKAVNTVAACVLLGMAMAAFSMLVDRSIYPRKQIAIASAVIPITTAVLLGFCSSILRAVRDGAMPEEEDEWVEEY